MPARLGRYRWVICAVLFAAALVSNSLSLSRVHRAPTYDEVAYLDTARGFAELGGPVGAIACHQPIHHIDWHLA